MVKHKGLSIRVGTKTFHDVGKMNRSGLWTVQDAIEREQSNVSHALQGNVSAATTVQLHNKMRSLEKRAERVRQLIRCLHNQ
jgi:hypothetical protein